MVLAKSLAGSTRQLCRCTTWKAALRSTAHPSVSKPSVRPLYGLNHQGPQLTASIPLHDMRLFATDSGATPSGVSYGVGLNSNNPVVALESRKQRGMAVLSSIHQRAAYLNSVSASCRGYPGTAVKLGDQDAIRWYDYLDFLFDLLQAFLKYGCVLRAGSLTVAGACPLCMRYWIPFIQLAFALSDHSTG